jgi:hypothetical protein
MYSQGSELLGELALEQLRAGLLLIDLGADRRRFRASCHASAIVHHTTFPPLGSK